MVAQGKCISFAEFTVAVVFAGKLPGKTLCSLLSPDESIEVIGNQIRKNNCL